MRKGSWASSGKRQASNQTPIATQDHCLRIEPVLHLMSGSQAEMPGIGTLRNWALSSPRLTITILCKNEYRVNEHRVADDSVSK